MSAADEQARTLLDYALDGDTTKLRNHARRMKERYWRPTIRREGADVVVQVKRASWPAGVARWFDPRGQLYSALYGAVNVRRKPKGAK